MRHLFKLAAGAFALTPVSGFGLAPRAPCLSSVDRIVPASTQPCGSRGQSRATAAVCPDINMIATASGGTPRGQPPRGRGAAAKKVRREVIFCGALQCFCRACVSHCCRCCALQVLWSRFLTHVQDEHLLLFFLPISRVAPLAAGAGGGSRCKVQGAERYLRFGSMILCLHEFLQGFHITHSFCLCLTRKYRVRVRCVVVEKESGANCSEKPYRHPGTCLLGPGSSRVRGVKSRPWTKAPHRQIVSAGMWYVAVQITTIDAEVSIGHLAAPLKSHVKRQFCLQFSIPWMRAA